MEEFLARLHETISESSELNWIAAETSVSMLLDEVLVRRLGAVPPPGTPTLEERAMSGKQRVEALRLAAAPTTFPPMFSWQAHGYLNEVRDQGNCGTGVAFGVASAIEAQMRIATRLPVNAPAGEGSWLSEAQMFFCNGRACEIGTPQSGWWPTDALQSATHQGVIPESDFPYDDHTQACNIPPYNDEHLTMLNHTHSITNINEMKEWLATHGPLITTMSVHRDFFHYDSGVYKYTDGELLGGQCLCCVGYDDTKQAWLCKNSWGTDWGMDGYCWIGYGQCGIDAEMWAIDDFKRIYFDWMGDQQITLTDGTSPLTAGPLAMATQGNKVHLVFQGNDNNTLWWCWFDGAKWGGNRQITLPSGAVPLARRALALAIYGNKLHLVFQGLDANTLWWCWYDGTQWEGNQQITLPNGVSPLSNGTIALAAFGNKLHLVYQGLDTNTLWWCWYDGSKWDGSDQPITMPSGALALTQGAFSLAAYKDKLHLIYQGYDTPALWWCWFDGAKWDGNQQLTLTNGIMPITSGALALAVKEEKLHLVFQGSGSHAMWWCWFDGMKWEGNTRIITADLPLTSGALSLTQGMNDLYLVYQGLASSSMWYSVLRGEVGKAISGEQLFLRAA